MPPAADREQEEGPSPKTPPFYATEDLGHSGKTYLSERYIKGGVGPSLPLRGAQVQKRVTTDEKD